ncbi:hypothetical protein JW698_01625 [Candidatus Wolfebacteria bacterium]|nr:hypothetical protein [Candidatus Wolfebacteria bacterium]
MISDFVNSFIAFFINNLLIIQILSFCISSILLGFIIYFIFNGEIFKDSVSQYAKTFNKNNFFSGNENLKIWDQIQKRLESKKADQLKIAVIEADNILNNFLREAGYKGKNLEERLLKITSVELCNIEELKQVHKTRKKIDTEPEFFLNYGEAKTIVDIYKKALQDLNLIN